jgi:hypothetical protein
MAAGTQVDCHMSRAHLIERLVMLENEGAPTLGSPDDDRMTWIGNDDGRATWSG